MLAPWQQILIRGLFHYSAKRMAIQRAMSAKDEHVPARLFKYRQFTKRHLEALEKDELWLASPNRFNDPFDTAIYYDVERLSIDDRRLEDLAAGVEARNALRAEGKVPERRPLANPMPTGKWVQRELTSMLKGLPEKMRERFEASLRAAIRESYERNIRDHSARLRNGVGVLSLSENCQSVLMWSHYADCHRGLCLEYNLAELPATDFRRRFCYPVFYRRKRTDATRYLSKEGSDFNRFFEQYLCLLKSDEWAYEREWRIVQPFGASHANRPLKMPPPQALILGAATTQEASEWAVSFCVRRKIPLRLARQSMDSFRMEILDIEDDA